MRVLLIRPVPAEFGACRETLLLRDPTRISGCRAARGTSGGVEILALESGLAKVRAAAATAAACLQCGPDAETGWFSAQGASWAAAEPEVRARVNALVLPYGPCAPHVLGLQSKEGRAKGRMTRRSRRAPAPAAGFRTRRAAPNHRGG